MPWWTGDFSVFPLPMTREGVYVTSGGGVESWQDLDKGLQAEINYAGNKITEMSEWMWQRILRDVWDSWGPSGGAGSMPHDVGQTFGAVEFAPMGKSHTEFLRVVSAWMGGDQGNEFEPSDILREMASGGKKPNGSQDLLVDWEQGVRTGDFWLCTRAVVVSMGVLDTLLAMDPGGTAGYLRIAEVITQYVNLWDRSMEMLESAAGQIGD